MPNFDPKRKYWEKWKKPNHAILCTSLFMLCSIDNGTVQTSIWVAMRKFNSSWTLPIFIEKQQLKNNQFYDKKI